MAGLLRAVLSLLPLLVGATLPQTSFAQAVADPSAPGGQRPTVLETSNGIPLVNIRTPSAAGVSHNTYNQLDVGKEGMVFNNSRTNVQTNLGGWVQGNPWLAKGSARIILNEVNSNDPSLLNGYMEVAGDKAEFIIANPSGISCNDCGVINASRVTLTTGTPVFRSGNLSDFRVEGGAITISGQFGLDTSTSDYTDIIAESVKLNAFVWANDLTLTTGTNVVSVDRSSVQEIKSGNTKPMVSLDVGHLGGMYAGKIKLVGTQDGVGVRNAGQINASSGGLVLTADGRLVNSGRIQSKSAPVEISSTETVENTGAIVTAGTLSVSANGSLSNAGDINATGDIALYALGEVSNSGRVWSANNVSIDAAGASGAFRGASGSLLAAGVDANGSIGTSGQVTVNAVVFLGNAGAAHSGQNLAFSADQIDLSNSRVSSSSIALNSAQSNVDLSFSKLFAGNSLIVKTPSAVISNGGDIESKTVTIDAHSFSNVSGSLRQTGTADLDLSFAGDLDNTDGVIATNASNAKLAGASFTNADGEISHAGAGTLDIDATTFSGERGQVLTNGVLDVTASTLDLDGARTQAQGRIAIDSASFSHRDGVLVQAGSEDGSIRATTRLDNTGGLIDSAGSLQATVGGLTNQGGTLQVTGADKTLLIASSGAVDNSQLNGTSGDIFAAGDLTVAAGSLDNSESSISSGGALGLTSTGALDNTSGRLVAQQAVTLSASELDNEQGTVGSVDAGVDLTATGGAVDNGAGRIEAATSVAIASQGLENGSGLILGQSQTIDAGTQALNNQSGRIIASGQGAGESLSIKSGALNNDGGLIQAASGLAINTQGQSLTNTNSGSQNGILSQGSTTLTTGDLNNTAGYVGSSSNLNITGADIDNRSGGTLLAGAALDVTGTSLDNRTGKVQAVTDLSIELGTGTLNNSASLISAGGHTEIAAGTLLNTNTKTGDTGIHAASVEISARQYIDNTEGRIRADAQVDITSGQTFNNTDGLVSSVTAGVTVQDINLANKALDITNTDGEFLASTMLRVDSASLTGDGTLYSAGDINISLVESFTHTGELSALGSVQVATQGNIDNRSEIRAADTVELSGASIINNDGSAITGGTIKLQATAANTLTNRGLLNATTLEIDTVTLNNLGTGRIYGDQISIAATTLNNQAEGGNAPVIAARQRLDIGAGTVNNSNEALIFSAGSLHMGGSLDADGHASGQGSVLNNNGATIESLGNMSLAFNQINNSNLGVTTEVQNLGNENVTEFKMNAGDVQRASDLTTRYTPDQVTLSVQEAGVQILTVDANGDQSDAFSEYQFTRQTQQEVVTSSAPGKILSGGRMEITAGTLNNDKSEIIAGGDLEANIGTLNNIAITGEKITTDSGTATSFWRHRQKGSDTSHSSTVDYQPAPVVETISIAPAVFEANTTVSGTNTQVDGLANSPASKNITVSIGTISGTRNDQQANATSSVGTNSAQVANAVDSVLANGLSTPRTGLQSEDRISETSGKTAAVNTQLSGPDVSELIDVQTAVGSALAISKITPKAGGAAGPVETLLIGDVAFDPKDFNGTIVPITQVSQKSGDDADRAGIVLTGGVAFDAPQNSLFSEQADAPNGFIIETDPAFANYRNWLSSDYMLNALAIDPELTQKRLGDGFYEQRLIREQISQLTGRRFLEGFSNDEEQYRQLMMRGVAFAETHNLRPGIALSGEQMASLTSDIVWLESQTVQLSTGESVEVLVPRVYVVVSDETLPATNGMIASDEVLNLDVAGDLNNFGNLFGQRVASISAENVRNTGGRIAGNSVQVAAANDIINSGGSIRARDSLTLSAGRDIAVASTTTTQVGHQGSRTNIDRRGQIETTSDNSTLSIDAGRDVILRGAQVNSQGETRITAGQDVRLETVEVASDNQVTWDQNNYSREFARSDVGTVVQSEGALDIQAGRDLNSTSANVQSSESELNVRAGRDINIAAGKSVVGVDEASQHKSRGFLSSRTLTTKTDVEITSAQGSSFGGEEINLNAGRDVLIEGSRVLAEDDVNISAERNIEIVSAESTIQDESLRKEKRSGLLSGGGFGFTIGKRVQTSDTDQERVKQDASTIGSLSGDVNINAGETVTIAASDILTRQGDVSISGDAVNLEARDNTTLIDDEQRFEQSGLTVSLSGGVVDTLNTIKSSSERIGEVEDDRLKALHAWRLGRAATELPDQATALGDAKTLKDTGISLNVSIGRTESTTSRQVRNTNALGSSILSEGDASITARGNGAAQNSGDITSEGTLIRGDKIALAAQNDIHLNSAENSETDNIQSKSKSFGIGISIGSNGVGVNVNASKSRGEINQTDDKYLETLIEGGSEVAITSGADTTLEGAQVKADRVTADVGGDLTITSQQDEESYRNRQESSGFSLTAGPGTFSGSVNHSELKADSNYQSVQEQSGIFAGEDGFDVAVNGSTDLTGGAIISGADPDKNRLTTETLTVDRLENTAEFDLESKSVGLSLGGDQVGLGGGMAQDDGRTENITYSAISEGDIEVRSDPDALHDPDLKRSRDQAHETLDRIFDPEKDVKALQEQAEATKLFAEEGFKLVGDIYAKSENARKNANEVRDLYDNGKVSLEDVERLEAEASALEARLPNKAIAHAIVGGLTAAMGGGDFLQGAAAAGLNEAASNQLAETIDDPLTRNLVATLIGGALGGEQGALIAGSADKFNRQLHPTELEFLEDKKRLERYRDKIAEETGREITLQEAEDALKVAALVLVSESWKQNLHADADPLATSFLKQEAVGRNYLDINGKQHGLLVATEAERNDDFINLEYYSEVRKGLQTVMPGYDLGDALEELVMPWALVKGAGSELKNTVMDSLDAIEAATDPETYAKMQRIATMLEEDPERAKALLTEAGQEFVEGLKSELELLDNKFLLYQDQKRIHDADVAASEIALGIVNPFKKVIGGVNTMHSIVKAIPNDKLDLPEAGPKSNTSTGSDEQMKSSHDEFADPVQGEDTAYTGGAHKETKQPVGDRLDSHHCPAKKCYENAPISSEDGPAIKMEPADHGDTASWGNSNDAKEYRAQQKALLDEGRLEEAIQMDIDDIRSKFGSKYDSAIQEMIDYAKTLDPDVFKSR